MLKIMQLSSIRLAVFFLVLASSTAWAAESALVSSLKGEAWLSDSNGGKAPLQAFIKLRDGERLILGESARLQLTYFRNARQEVWQGPGIITIGPAESRAEPGRLQSQTRQLPMQLASQLAKTPAPNSQGKTVALRTRSIAPPESLERIKKTYLDMRAQTPTEDRNPELYLLSAYFEIKEYARVREVLRQMDASNPGDMEIKVLKSLYARAINNASQAAK
jgi:hypothetical protein